MCFRRIFPGRSAVRAGAAAAVRSGLGPAALGPAVLAPAVLGLAVFSAAGCTDAGADESAAAMELTEVVAYWTVRGQDSEGNNYIRPAVRFRVRNANAEPIRYVQVMSVFRRESAPEEAWGTGYLHSISEDALAPGEATPEHTLRSDSNYLSKDSPARMFASDLWEDVEVEMFLRVGASAWAPKGKTVALRRLGPPGVEKYLEPAEDEPVYAPDPADEAASETPEGSAENLPGRESR